MSETKELKLDKKMHVQFLLHHLKGLHPAYTSQDQNRITIIFFCVSGLDILDSLDMIENKQKIIDWIYMNQITTGHPGNCGFIGGPLLGDPSKTEGLKAHVTMTYTALATLLILGDDFSRVNKPSIIGALKYLQNENGSFRPVNGLGESDVRFSFCACAVASLLNDWSSINKKKLTEYLISCRRYDGAFGHVQNGESHAGSSFCVVSSLYQLGELKNIKDIERFKFWYFNRHKVGFNGRPNKDPDTCYTFWIGASLWMIGDNCLQMIDKSKIKDFVLKRQHNPSGGISKHNDCLPDILHTCLSLSGLSILEIEDLQPMYPPINVTKRSLRKLEHFKDI